MRLHHAHKPEVVRLFAQDAKAFMVAWRGGRQVAEVPRTKLNLPPGRWLGLTTAAGLAGALYFARTHTTPLNLFIGQVIDHTLSAMMQPANQGVCAFAVQQSPRPPGLYLVVPSWVHNTGLFS